MIQSDLTDKQYRILKFIVDKIEEGSPPTIREIGEHFVITSTLGVRDHLKALESKGYIKRREWKARGIELVQGKVRKLFYGYHRIPLVGRVAAGEPILAVENIEDVISLESLLPKDGVHFALRVQGDSMVGAGIFPGDIVIVRQQPTAEIGDIVVAIIGEEGTVKRLTKIENKIYLEPANPKYEPISSKDVEIVGKVVGVFRQLR